MLAAILLALLQDQPSISFITIATLGAGISSAAVGAGINWITSNKASARLEGVVTTKLAEFDNRFKEVTREQEQQWTKINQNSLLYAEMKGRFEGLHSKSHHA